MTSPAANTGSAYQDTAHQPEPTPDQGNGDVIAAVAALLLLGGAVQLLAAAILRLLRRRGRPKMSLQAVTLAVAIASSRTKHQPRMIGRSDVARAQARMETYYRAAYIINASDRIQAALDAATAPFDAVAKPVPRPGEAPPVDEDRQAALDAAAKAAAARERSYEAAHERARRRRMAAALEVADAANRYGPLLGWYSHRDDRTTPECRMADGSNFRADTPPVIGWPKTLHGGTCRCEAGPPHPRGPSTDQATGFGGYRR